MERAVEIPTLSMQRDDPYPVHRAPEKISRPVSMPPGLVHVVQNDSSGFSKVTPHIGSADPKDGVFGDICSVIRDTLEIAGDTNRMQRLVNEVRRALHSLVHGREDLVVHTVHLVVSLQDSLGRFRITGDEGLE